MGGTFDGLFDRYLQKRMLKRWRNLADSAEALDLDSLRGLRGAARQHQRSLDRVLHVAETRLSAALAPANPLRLPPGTDWSWRPDLWAGPVSTQGYAEIANATPLCDSAKLFHDCHHSEISTRQIRNLGSQDTALYGFKMDVLHFDGSFLSLVLDLPKDAVQGLRTKHLIQLSTTLELERPIEIFARLNVKHGPNVEQTVRELPLGGDQAVVEFDMFYTKLNEKRVEQAWIDLIFEGPAFNQITLRDLTVSRRPRAEL